MKTIKEHLNDLKEPERTSALKALDADMADQMHPTLADSIFLAFAWGEPFHGNAYWSGIHNKLEAGTYFDAPQLTEESCGEAARKTMYGIPKRMATGEDYDKLDELTAIFPEDDEERQKYAVGTFICEFFPHAIAELARFSYDMQQKHNPGAPMGWAKEKSVGDGNQIFRHQMDGEFREVAWRGLEQLERFLTKMEPFNDK